MLENGALLKTLIPLACLGLAGLSVAQTAKPLDPELKLIAAAAIMGDSNRPKMGYNTPAATGTPSEL